MAGGEFRRIGHDADILVAGGVQRLADGADAPVHHFRRRDDVGAGIGLDDGGAGDQLHRLVVHDDAVAQDAVMAVAGEGVERDVGDDADFRHGLLHGGCRLVDQVLTFEDLGTRDVAQVHLDIREGGNRRDAEGGCLFRGLDQLVDAHAIDAGHCGNRIDNARTGNHEDRPDQVVHRQRIFAHEAAGPVGLAVAAHAAMAGDVVDGVGLVGHVRGPSIR